MESQFKKLVADLEPISLEKGDSGSAVKTLQEVLRSLSLYHGEPDGCFGSQLENSIRHLQGDLGLSPTGLFDSPTWYALTFWAKHEYSGAARPVQMARGFSVTETASPSLSSMMQRTAQLFGARFGSKT